MLGLTKPFAIPTYFFVIIVFIHSLWKKIHKINIAMELKQKNPHQQKPARLNLYKSEHLASPNQRGVTFHEQNPITQTNVSVCPQFCSLIELSGSI